MRRRCQPLSCLILLVAQVVTLWRTARGPNDWAEAQWLLDYRFGFVKRGLAGQLLSWATGLFGGEVDERAIRVVAFTAFVVLNLGLLAIALGLVRRAAFHPAAVAAMTAFLCSPFVVMTGHLVGYLDQVFLPLGIVSIWLALRGRVFAGAVVQTAALFVHESCIALVFPAFALAALHGAGVRAPTRSIGRELWPLLLPLATAALMGRMIGAPPPGFTVQYSAWLKQHGFVQQGFDTLTPDLLSWTLPQFWAVVSPHLGERMAKPSSIGLVLPTLFVLLASLRARVRLDLLSPTTLAATGVVLLPLGMHLVAWDLERIWTFALFAALLVVWVFDARHGAPAPREADGTFAMALATVGLNFVVETPLMDLETDHLSRTLRASVMIGLLVALLLQAIAYTAGQDEADERRWPG